MNLPYPRLFHANIEYFALDTKITTPEDTQAALKQGKDSSSRYRVPQKLLRGKTLDFTQADATDPVAYQSPFIDRRDRRAGSQKRFERNTLRALSQKKPFSIQILGAVIAGE